MQSKTIGTDGTRTICGDGICVDTCESPGYKCKCDSDTHINSNDTVGTCKHKTRECIYMIYEKSRSLLTNDRFFSVIQRARASKNLSHWILNNRLNRFETHTGRTLFLTEV